METAVVGAPNRTLVENYILSPVIERRIVIARRDSREGTYDVGSFRNALRIVSTLFTVLIRISRARRSINYKGMTQDLTRHRLFTTFLARIRRIIRVTLRNDCNAALVIHLLSVQIKRGGNNRMDPLRRAREMNFTVVGGDLSFTLHGRYHKKVQIGIQGEGNLSARHNDRTRYKRDIRVNAQQRLRRDTTVLLRKDLSYPNCAKGDGLRLYGHYSSRRGEEDRRRGFDGLRGWLN